MKSKIKLTQEFICKLPTEVQDSLAEKLKGVEENDLFIHRKSIDDDPKVMEVENDEKRITLGYASTRTMDRDYEIIVPDGMDLSQYRKNPVLLWAHNWSEQPIGKMPDIKSDGFGLRGISEYATTKLATEIWTLVKGGFLRTHSIGFIPTKWAFKGDTLYNAMLERAFQEWPEFTTEDAEKLRGFVLEAVMLENSVVPIPSNTDALIQEVVGKGYSSSLIKSLGINENDLEDTDDEDDDEEADDQNQGDKEPHIIVISTPVKVIKTPEKAPVIVPTAQEVKSMVDEQLRLMKGGI